MKPFTWPCLAVGLFAAALSAPAPAVTMTVTPLSISQISLGAAFSVGHFIDARSFTQNLTITGGFVVTCSEPAIPAIRESYSATQTVLLQENVFSKSIPEPLPAQRSFSGWNQVKTGTVVNCNYQLPARAVESGINFGTGGGTIVIGGGEKSEDRGIPFDMIKIGVYYGPGCLD
jgi:hypothetical protein